MLEDWDLNRSVMPFDVLGSTCVTLMETILFLRTEVCCLSVVVFVPNYNVECLVSVNQQFVLNMSLFLYTQPIALMPLNCSVERRKKS